MGKSVSRVAAFLILSIIPSSCMNISSNLVSKNVPQTPCLKVRDDNFTQDRFEAGLPFDNDGKINFIGISSVVHSCFLYFQPLLLSSSATDNAQLIGSFFPFSCEKGILDNLMHPIIFDSFCKCKIFLQAKRAPVRQRAETRDLVLICLMQNPSETLLPRSPPAEL